MKKIFLLLIANLVLFTSFCAAQEIKVSGTVKDKQGEIIPFAYIQIKNTDKGTTVLEDGSYSIAASPGDVLVFTFLGYSTKKVPVNGRKVIDVIMEEDAIMLEQTVVVGYGTAKKISSVVGSASTVKSKIFQNKPVANIGDALQGQVAGLQVFTSTGEPSASVSMRLRGVSSINASTTPLFILDGAPVSAQIFSALNPSDIENISVMKDASSTAIYGSRAANGVVYITTKKGIEEEPVVQLRAQYGFSSLVKNKHDMMNSQEWFTLREMQDPSLLANAAFQANKEFRLANNIGTNWEKFIFSSNAPVWNADLSVSGKGKKSDYYISLGAMDQTGILPFSGASRYSVRSNINTRATNWLKVGLNLGLSYQKNKTAAFATSGSDEYNPINIASWSLPWASAHEILKDKDGNFIGYGNELDYIEDLGKWNYKYVMGIQPNHETYVRLNGSLYQEITPIKGLVIRAAQSVEGFDYRNKRQTLPLGPFQEQGNGKTEAYVSEYFNRFYQLTSTNTVEYKFTIGKKNNFVILAGQEAILTNEEGFGAASKEHTDFRLIGVNNGLVAEMPSYELNEVAYNSLFARFSYDYDGKYFADVSYRRDGSSRFGANRRYADFYSVGVMWNLKQENFLKAVTWIDDLRFKASFGTTGNSGIGNYLSYGLVKPSNQQYGGTQSWYISNPGNFDLTWETVENLNIGVNARLFNLLNLNVEFYNKKTKDMLMEIPYSFTTGFSYGWGNVGNMLNTGVDIELNIDVINKNHFYFNIGANFNYNKNKISALFGGRDEFVVPNTGLKYQVGIPLGEFYMVRYAGVDPANGKQLWLDKDGTLTDVYAESNAVFTGKQRFAPCAGGIQLNFAWKGLSLNADFTGVFGKWVANNDRYFIENVLFAAEINQTGRMLTDSWRYPGHITDIPKFDQERKIDTHILENASFVRLKNLQLSYIFPKKLMKKAGILNGAKIYAVGRNLFTITEYSGYDPEADTNIQMGVYPNSKQFTFGIELTF